MPCPEESFGGGRLSKEQRPKDADERAVVNMEAQKEIKRAMLKA